MQEDQYAAAQGYDYSFVVYALSFVLILAIILKIVSWLDRIVVAVLHRKKQDSERDSVRTYRLHDRKIFSSKCNDRCEGVGIFFRCTRRGNLQGDHWYPHSRGGATTKKNLVMLCQKCNGRKLAHVPSVFQTYALYFRRKIGWGYNGMDEIKPGEWLSRSQIRKNRRENDITAIPYEDKPYF